MSATSRRPTAAIAVRPKAAAHVLGNLEHELRLPRHPDRLRPSEREREPDLRDPGRQGRGHSDPVDRGADHRPAGAAARRLRQRPHLEPAGPAAALLPGRAPSLASLALVAMPNSPTLWVAAGMLWIMDASINISMEPFRAFVGDNLPSEQRTTGFAMQSFLIGTGAVVASLLPWLLTNQFGVSNQAPPGHHPRLGPALLLPRRRRLLPGGAVDGDPLEGILARRHGVVRGEPGAGRGRRGAPDAGGVREQRRPPDPARLDLRRRRGAAQRLADPRGGVSGRARRPPRLPLPEHGLASSGCRTRRSRGDRRLRPGRPAAVRSRDDPVCRPIRPRRVRRRLYANDGSCGTASRTGSSRRSPRCRCRTTTRARCFTDDSAVHGDRRRPFVLALDAGGELLIPVGWASILVRPGIVPVPRLIRTRIASPLPFDFPARCSSTRSHRKAVCCRPSSSRSSTRSPRPCPDALRLRRCAVHDDPHHAAEPHLLARAPAVSNDGTPCNDERRLPGRPLPARDVVGGSTRRRRVHERRRPARAAQCGGGSSTSPVPRGRRRGPIVLDRARSRSSASCRPHDRLQRRRATARPLVRVRRLHVGGPDPVPLDGSRRRRDVFAFSSDRAGSISRIGTATATLRHGGDDPRPHDECRRPVPADDGL